MEGRLAKNTVKSAEQTQNNNDKRGHLNGPRQATLFACDPEAQEDG